MLSNQNRLKKIGNNPIFFLFQIYVINPEISKIPRITNSANFPATFEIKFPP